MQDALKNHAQIELALPKAKDIAPAINIAPSSVAPNLAAPKSGML